MGRKPRWTKRQAQAWHVKHRAHQRLGLLWTMRDLEALVGRIQRGESRFVERQSNTRTLHRMVVAGRDVTMVYDSREQMIVSVWPTERADEGEVR